jgi:hypothetical protein
VNTVLAQLLKANAESDLCSVWLASVTDECNAAV